MKKYLALAVLGFMLMMVQPVLAACPVCPQQALCPTCPPKMVYQPVLQPVAPVIQTVVEPVLTQSYRYRQIATCPTCPTCPSPCDPCGITGAAAPIFYPQTIMYEKQGFWSKFFGFD